MENEKICSWIWKNFSVPKISKDQNFMHGKTFHSLVRNHKVMFLLKLIFIWKLLPMKNEIFFSSNTLEWYSQWLIKLLATIENFIYFFKFGVINIINSLVSTKLNNFNSYFPYISIFIRNNYEIINKNITAFNIL